MIGKSATTSELIHGLLIENTNTGANFGCSKCHLSHSAKARCNADSRAKRNSEGLILTALFDVSMAGDLPEGRCVALFPGSTLQLFFHTVLATTARVEAGNEASSLDV